MAAKKIKTGELVGKAWDIFKQEWPVLLGFLAVSVFINMFIGMAGYEPSHVQGVRQAMTNDSVLLSIIGWIAGLLLGVAGIAITLLVARGHKVTKDALMEFFTVWGIVYYFITSLFVGILVMVGSLLLIIPGIYFMLRFMFAQYLVVDKCMGPIEAMKESSRLTYGYKWQLLKLVLMVVLLNIAGALALIVGLLVSIPVTMIMMAMVYVQIADKSDKSDEEDEVIEVEKVEEGDTTDKK